MTKESGLFVFTYGTLKPGGRYHNQYCQDYLTAAVPAVVKGQLFDFPQLGYPAMTAGEDWVQGYLLKFLQPRAVCDEVLRRLDTLEGYRPESLKIGNKASSDDSEDDYTRCKVSVFSRAHEPLQVAWVYQMSMTQVRALKGVYLPDGRWQVV